MIHNAFSHPLTVDIAVGRGIYSRYSFKQGGGGTCIQVSGRVLLKKVETLKIKGTVKVISSDPSITEFSARFTTEPCKPLSDKILQ